MTVNAELPRFVYAGIIRGAGAGIIRVVLNGKTTVEIPLVFSESVPADESQRASRWERIMLAESVYNGSSSL